MNILDTLTTAWQSAALGARTIVLGMYTDRIGSDRIGSEFGRIG